MIPNIFSGRIEVEVHRNGNHTESIAMEHNEDREDLAWYADIGSKWVYDRAADRTVVLMRNWRGYVDLNRTHDFVGDLYLPFWLRIEREFLRLGCQNVSVNKEEQTIDITCDGVPPHVTDGINWVEKK